jgi:hypothetical protein
MNGFDVDRAVLEAVASTLHGAGADLESMADPPPAPEVGACTAAVSAVLALLTESIGGVVEGLGVVGGAVADSNVIYGEIDANARTAFDGLSLG